MVSEVSQAESQNTLGSVVYSSAVEMATGFLRDHWQEIIGGLMLFILVLFILRNRIHVFFLNRKIASLELEKQILQNLIKKTQADYFEKKSMPEESYTVRINKFSELIRDIDRQVPLLREQIAKRK